MIILVQGLTNHGLPIFVNKVILEHSHTHSFKYCLWLPLHHSSGVEWFLQRLYGLQTENMYDLALYRMRLLTPAFLCLHSSCLVRSHNELEVSEMIVNLFRELR